MAPEDLRNTLNQQPFRPFRIVMTDGKTFDIHHQDFLMIGKRVALVGVTDSVKDEFFDLEVKINLPHIVRLEPLELASRSQNNGEHR